MTETSGGVPVTRGRLSKVLTGLPVRVVYTARAHPFRWSIAHDLDLRRQFHPYNRMGEAEFNALRDPDVEGAAQELGEAGYHVLLRQFPDAVLLAELPEAMRGQFQGMHPMLQVWLVPDSE